MRQSGTFVFIPRVGEYASGAWTDFSGKALIIAIPAYLCKMKSKKS